MPFPLNVYSPPTVIVTVSNGVKAYVEVPSQLSVLDGKFAVLPAVCRIATARAAKSGNNHTMSIAVSQTLLV